jgi:hypothetical protein
VTSHQFLSDEQIAGYFLQSNTVRSGEDALDLEARVQSWLERSGMSHRSALAVAVEAVKLARPEPEPVRQQPPPPGDGQRIRELTMAQYAQERRSQYGMGEPDLLSFLAGE